MISVVSADSAPASAWSPLLEGESAREAIDAVEAIGACLTDEQLLARHPTHTLAEGKPGFALLYGYLALARPGQGHDAVSKRLRDECTAMLASVRMNASLYGGFCGVLWTLAHLAKGQDQPGRQHPHDEVDRALCNHLATSPWRGAYDLVSGLVGHGVYALERLPDPLAVACLERVVERLDELAERTESGITWPTRRQLPRDSTRVRTPSVYHNLGVAHGVPGAIALLGATCGAGVAEERARPLVDGAVRWLLAQRLPASGGSRFAYWLAPDEEPIPARSAWCYGDPGVAASLLVAARCARMPAWELDARDLALLAARRPPEQSGAREAGLCHGAAGLGHLFNRMYQVTGEPELGRAARHWIRRTLEMRRPGTGVAGFSSLADPDAGRWVSDPGFLTGAAGVALALLAATCDVDPAWDRLLLASVPASASLAPA